MQALTIAFTAFLLLWGCQNSGATGQREATKGQGETTMADKASVSRIARPPIDLAAPAKTETATFALG